MLPYNGVEIVRADPLIYHMARHPLLWHHHHPRIYMMVMGMVMMGFVGVATFHKSGTGATSKLRNDTQASSCAYHASCAAGHDAAVGALGSQTLVMTYRIPRHTRVSLLLVG